MNWKGSRGKGPADTEENSEIPHNSRSQGRQRETYRNEAGPGGSAPNILIVKLSGPRNYVK
jgi:hypothetical protein